MSLSHSEDSSIQLSPIVCQTHLVLRDHRGCPTLGAFANSIPPPDRLPGPVGLLWKDVLREPWLVHTNFHSTVLNSFPAASVDSGIDTSFGWVPEFLMSSPLAWGSWSSSPGQNPHLSLSTFLTPGDTPSSLLLSFSFSYLSPPVTLAYSSPDTSWVSASLIIYVLTWELFSWDWGSSS